MNDPFLEIPQELDPSFDAWKGNAEDYACRSDAGGIGEYDGHTLWIGIGGGEYEQKGLALASRIGLRCLCIDGRNIPQQMIDAAGEIQGLERLQLGNIGPRSLAPLQSLSNLKSLYLEGIKGQQQWSFHGLSDLKSVLVSGDTEAISSLLREGNPNVRYLALGGTSSANLRLADLSFLGGFPGIEHLVLFNVTVSSRSLDPCLLLSSLQNVIVNFARQWDPQSIDTLKAKGVSVRSRMDEIRSQLD
jgi:hypothetical protein